MNLPSGLFQAALESFKGQTPAQQEMRDGARYRTLGSATIIPCSSRVGRTPVVVGVCDVSPAGIGIIHCAAMRVGDAFILAIPSNAAQGRRAALFSVIFTQTLSNGNYRIGAAFSRELRAGAADDGIVDQGAASATVSARKAATTPLHACALAKAFREQATSGLTSEEQSQLSELEKRLAAAGIN